MLRAPTISWLTICPLGQPEKAIGRESQIEPWLAFANTLLAGAKSSHGTTQPKMNPQPDLRSGTKVDAAEKGLDVRKKTFLGIREKCFFLTSPFIEPRVFRGASGYLC